MVKSSIPRLRSVTFKDGRAPLRVIYRSQDSGRRDGFIAAAKEIADVRLEIEGYVIVAWTKGGDTSVCCATDGAPIPILLPPEFVKTCVADWVHSKDSE